MYNVWFWVVKRRTGFVAVQFKGLVYWSAAKAEQCFSKFGTLVTGDDIAGDFVFSLPLSALT